MWHGVDLRAGDASQIRVQVLHARRYLVVGKHQVCIHALEHVLCGRANVIVGQVDLFDDPGQVGEAAAVVGSQNALIGDVQALENIHHVVPALKWQQCVRVGEVLRFFWRFLAIAVICGVEVTDAVGLTQRFNQERVIGPARTRNLSKANAMFVQERFAIDGRPNGWMMA